jgi:hypothetical protein
LEPLGKTPSPATLPDEIKTPRMVIAHTPTMPLIESRGGASGIHAQILAIGAATSSDIEDNINPLQFKYINKFNETLLFIVSSGDSEDKKRAILELCKLKASSLLLEKTECEGDKTYLSSDDLVKYYSEMPTQSKTPLPERLASLEKESLILETLTHDFFNIWLSVYEDFLIFTDTLKGSESLFEMQYQDEEVVEKTIDSTRKMTSEKRSNQKSITKIQRAAKKEILELRQTSSMHPAAVALSPKLKAFCLHPLSHIKILANVCNISKKGLITVGSLLYSQLKSLIAFDGSPPCELSNLEKAILNLKDSIAQSEKNLNQLPKILRFLQYSPLYLLHTSNIELRRVLESENCISKIVNFKIVEFSRELNLAYDLYDKDRDASNALLNDLRSKLDSLNILNESIYQRGIIITRSLIELTSAAATFLLPNLEKVSKGKKMCIAALKMETAKENAAKKFSEESAYPAELRTSTSSYSTDAAESLLSCTPHCLSESIEAESDTSPPPNIDLSSQYRSIQNIEFLFSDLKNNEAGGEFAIKVFNLMSSLSVLFEELIGSHDLISMSKKGEMRKLFSTLELLNRLEIYSRRAYTNFSSECSGIVSEIIRLTLTNTYENFRDLAIKFNLFTQDCVEAYSDLTGGLKLHLPEIIPPETIETSEISESLRGILEITQRNHYKDLEWNILRLNSILKSNPSKEAFTCKYGLATHLIFIIAEEFVYAENPTLDRKLVGHNLQKYLDERSILSPSLRTWFKSLYKESVASRFYDEEKSSTTQIHKSIKASFAPIATMKPKFADETWKIAETSAIKDMKQNLETHLIYLSDFVLGLSM